jgi:hypothetical protein
MGACALPAAIPQPAPIRDTSGMSDAGMILIGEMHGLVGRHSELEQ